LLQYSEFQPRLVHFQLRFPEFALLLLKLDLRLNDVRVCDFAALFKLLADVEEVACFGRCLLHVGVLPLCGHVSIVGLNHGHH